MSEKRPDLIQFMEDSGRAGVTVSFRIDHQRTAEGGKPWTMMLTGPGMGTEGSIRTDDYSVDDCIQYAVSVLRTRPGGGEWLDQYM
ncbi:hypothetical protein [Actinosynnema sp. NPDC020468]|uniref:hypothetical protein n=1 Tax=Actinosynnema sp. NPDC020468 TaxID=3154488 RepID=UPI0033C2A77C